MVERRFSRVLNVELDHVFFHNVNFQQIKILKLNKQALESFQKKIHPRLSCIFKKQRPRSYKFWIFTTQSTFTCSKSKIKTTERRRQ